ncbi:uncharacterized protein LOC121403956 [Drosophila obscura]|uniref:uncharacterized protein LOC121403956 n=1 Tax=Drosophila obscura TaxID=7282 RepID=UPI001BB143D7|nr:uncharacterized protein LOC121403956 [Drosophila obscura]
MLLRLAESTTVCRREQQQVFGAAPPQQHSVENRSSPRSKRICGCVVERGSHVSRIDCRVAVSSPWLFNIQLTSSESCLAALLPCCLAAWLRSAVQCVMKELQKNLDNDDALCIAKDERTGAVA